MPRFPEYDFELLTFREACALLPEAAARHLLVHGIEDLHPVYVRWGGEPTPTPAPLVWWLNHSGPADPIDGSAHLLWMLWHENRFGTHWAAAGHGGPSEPVEVFFDRKRVEAFKGSKKWKERFHAESDVPPEWLVEAGIDLSKGGRPASSWHELTADTAGVNEAAGRLPPLPEGVERFYKGINGNAMVRIDEDESVSRKHFQKVWRHLNPEEG